MGVVRGGPEGVLVAVESAGGVGVGRNVLVGEVVVLKRKTVAGAGIGNHHRERLGRRTVADLELGLFARAAAVQKRIHHRFASR